MIAAAVLAVTTAPLPPGGAVAPPITTGVDAGGPCSLPVIGSVCDAVGGAVAGVATSAAQTFVDGFADGFATLVKTMTTFWVKVPTPAINGAGGPVAHLHGLVYWIQGVVLVASILYVAGKTALDRSGQAMSEGGKGLALMILWVGAGAAGIDLLTAAGDAWSVWIIDQSANGSMVTRLAALSGGSATMTGLGIGLEFLISLIGILSCVAQIFLLLARVGVLTLLVGTLPLSAAGLATPAGRAWFNRIVGWIIAFVLYKPAAAMVYAAAFTLTGTGKDLTSVLSGLMLIVLAVFALPALMRLVAPMVAAASGGGGGAVTGALAGAALATGARQIADRSSSGGGGARGTTPGLADSSSSGSATGAPTGAASTGPSGSAGPSGSSGASGAGAAGGETAAAGSAGAAGGAAGAAGGGAAAGAGAAGAGAAAGPVGAAVVAGAQIVKAGHDAAKGAANNAADDATGGA